MVEKIKKKKQKQNKKTPFIFAVLDKHIKWAMIIRHYHIVKHYVWTSLLSKTSVTFVRAPGPKANILNFMNRIPYPFMALS